MSSEGICGSYFNDVQHTVVAKSDASGVVRVILTEQMDQIMTAWLPQMGRPEIDEISLRVDHPDYPIWWKSIRVKGDEPIVLADATTITVRAQRSNTTEPAKGLYPELSSTLTDDWTEADGVVTIRRVDLSSERASRWLRIVQVPENGPAWFSEIVDLKHIAGNPIALEVTLKPGVRVEGRLAETVPRPVQKGRAIAVAMRGSGQGGVGWEAVSEISADGTFVLESLPENETLTVMCLCGGWMSRSPTKTEVQAYATEYGVTGLAGSDPRAERLMPQLFRLDKPVVEAVVEMQPTAACEVTVLDPKGEPIPDASVQFWPNQGNYSGGSSFLGWGRDSATHIREQLAAGDHRRKSDRPADVAEYTAKTNARGVAVISGLPGAAADDFSESRQAMFQVDCEGYIAVSNFKTEVQAEYPFPILVAPLTSGKTERITVQMIPARIPGTPENVGSIEETGPAAVNAELSGQVVDEKGRPIAGVEVLPCNEDCLDLRSGKDGRFRHDFGGAPDDGDVPAFPVRFVKPGFAPLIVEMNLRKRDQVVTLQNKTYFEGIVRNPDGSPAANVRVRAHQHATFEMKAGSSPAPMSDYSIDLWTDTQTDAQGHYKLLVQPADYVIVAGNSSNLTAWIPKLRLKDAGHNERSEDPAAVPDPSDRPRLLIQPNAVKTLDIQLEASAEFRVRFIDSVAGRAVPDVQIRADNFPGIEGKSDESGFVTIHSLPVGEISFGIYARGYLRAGSEDASPRWKEAVTKERPLGSSRAMLPVYEKIPFDLVPGIPEATISLEPPVTISGRVLDPDGKPVAEAIVRLVCSSRGTSPGSFERRKFHTDKDGHFTAELPPSENGKYNLMACEDGRNHGSRGEIHFGAKDWRTWANGVGLMMATTAGQKIDNIELRLTRPGAIRGRVVDKTGKPVARAAVQSVAADKLDGAFHNPDHA